MAVLSCSWLSCPDPPKKLWICKLALTPQVVIYTRQGGKEVLWDVQWTGSEGTTTFFLLPG